jgi:hypothetical protein
MAPDGPEPAIGPGWRSWWSVLRLGLATLRDPNRVRVSAQGREFLPQARELPADDVLDLPFPDAEATEDGAAQGDAQSDLAEAVVLTAEADEDTAADIDVGEAVAVGEADTDAAEVDADVDGAGWP